jgi:hypothetical protein
MNHERCRVCGYQSNFVFWGKIFNDICVKYFSCGNCGYIQTEYPYWLDRAYKNPINSTDTGILVRNLRNRGTVLATLLVINDLIIKKCTVLDSSGGYGLLVRLLRDLGIDAWWSDPYAENIFASSFCDNMHKNYNLITSFESFEHFIEPNISFKDLICRTPNLLISTEIYPKNNPKPGEWFYFGIDHGQHIGFYKKNTLQYISSKYGLNLYSYANTYHLFSKNKINYVAWLVLMRMSSVLHRVIARLLKSKTESDSEILKNR